MNRITQRNGVGFPLDTDNKLDLNYDSNKIMREVILDLNRLCGIKLAKPVRLIKLHGS